MKKVSWELSNNFKIEEFYLEYDKNIYECAEDDVWVAPEPPVANCDKQNI